MKRTITFLAFCTLLPAALFAQAGTKELNVDGLKVIFKKTSKPTVSAVLCIRGGTANYATAQQGIEPLALHTALNGGTKGLPREAFQQQAEKLGTQFFASSGKDFSSMNMVALAESWDKSWAMFADAVVSPAFDETEFQTYKAQMLSSAKSEEANPDAYLRRVGSDQIYHGTDYVKSPSGLPETIEGLTLDATRAHYSKIVGRKRMYLVVVGNVAEADLVAKIRSTISRLPDGTPAAAPTYEATWAAAPSINNREMATNYILGQLRAPRYNTEDGPVFQFASSILQDRYFVELRTKRSLSYAPGAGYSRGTVQSPTSYIYISTIDPKQSLKVMTDILADIRQTGFTEKEVADKKKEFLTSYYMTVETSRDQAGAIAFAEASGDWRAFDALNEKVSKLTAAQVNSVFRRYLGQISWTYLGDPAKVTAEDFRQLEAAKGGPAKGSVQPGGR